MGWPPATSSPRRDLSIQQSRSWSQGSSSRRPESRDNRLIVGWIDAVRVSVCRRTVRVPSVTIAIILKGCAIWVENFKVKEIVQSLWRCITSASRPGTCMIALLMQSSLSQQHTVPLERRTLLKAIKHAIFSRLVSVRFSTLSFMFTLVSLLLLPVQILKITGIWISRVKLANTPNTTACSWPLQQ